MFLLQMRTLRPRKGSGLPKITQQVWLEALLSLRPRLPPLCLLLSVRNLGQSECCLCWAPLQGVWAHPWDGGAHTDFCSWPAAEDDEPAECAHELGAGDLHWQDSPCALSSGIEAPTASSQVTSLTCPLQPELKAGTWAGQGRQKQIALVGWHGGDGGRLASPRGAASQQKPNKPLHPEAPYGPQDTQPAAPLTHYSLNQLVHGSEPKRSPDTQPPLHRGSGSGVPQIHQPSHSISTALPAQTCSCSRLNSPCIGDCA